MSRLLRLETLTQYQTMGRKGPETVVAKETTVLDTSTYRLVMTAEQPAEGPTPGAYRAIFITEGQPSVDLLVVSPGVEVLYQTLGMEYPHDVPVFKGRVLELVGKFPLAPAPDEDPEPRSA